jgi:hypothetical protein
MIESAPAWVRGIDEFARFARMTAAPFAKRKKRSSEAAREGRMKVERHPWAQGGPLGACSGAQAHA